MRVLMTLRVDALLRPGGDTVQATQTKKALERLGIQVDLTVDPSASIKGYDVVHAFNLVRVHETYWIARAAARARVPLVLSPIYWDFDHLETRWQPPLAKLARRVMGRDLTERLKTAARILLHREWNRAAMAQLAYGYCRQQRYVVEVASCLLPNSRGEKELLERTFHRHQYVVIVPNAADELFARGDPARFYDKYGLRDFVLCVGRFEPLKNQLGVVLALRGTGLPLVFVGRPNPNYRGYYRHLRRIGEGWAHFLPWMSAIELADAYAAARVHVQASWIETTGLASLEAGLAGCNVVVTNRGPTREYFGDDAWYCDPEDVDSIRKAILDAWWAPRKETLRRRILRCFTWQRAAEATARGYRLALS